MPIDLSPNSPESPIEGLKELKPTLQNVWKAFGSLMMNWLLDKEVGEKGYKEVKESATENQSEANTPQALSQLRQEVEVEEAHPDFRPIGENAIEWDINQTITPEAILTAMKAYEGMSYEWGGTGARGGIDCSGLIIAALKDQLGIIRGDATAQWLYNRVTNPKENPDDVAVGDFVFWKKPKAKGWRKITHIAVVNKVLGGGKVQVTESGSSRGGYSETRVVDLNRRKENHEFLFGTPIFYGDSFQQNFDAQV